MNIIIRADSSSAIGTGHIMRDLVLAKQFPDANIIFAVRDLSGNINQRIVEHDYPLHILNSHDKEELVELVNSSHADILIIDHYSIDYEYEHYLKQHTKAKLFVLDDTYEKHDCDTLLNHNVSANEKRYENLVPKNCELRCGRKFTLLREEFYKAKQKKFKKQKNSILIALGGTDNTNLNEKVLRVLEDFKNIRVDLVTTTANIHLKRLQNYTKNKKWVTLHVNTNKMAELMARNALGIITPSVSANEAVFMDLDFVAIKIASNQDDMFQYLRKKRYRVMKKFDKKGLQCLLTNIGKKQFILKDSI